MGYANLNAAAQDLGLSINDPIDADRIGRLAQLDDTVSAMLDEKIGRSFGGTSTPVARVIQLPPRSGFGILTLPFPIRSVTSIVLTGDYPYTFGVLDYVLTMPVERTGDYHGIQRIDGGYWPGRDDGRSTLTITGVWSDLDTGDPVPVEIIEAATFVLVEEFRLRRASPNGEVGVSDGLVIQSRNPWNFEIVKVAMRKYGAAKSRASF